MRRRSEWRRRGWLEILFIFTHSDTTSSSGGERKGGEGKD